MLEFLKPTVIRAVLFAAMFVCLSRPLLAHSGIYRSNPEPGSCSLGALRRLSVGVWYDQENVERIVFDLNGTRIEHSPSDFASGFSEAKFGSSVWKFGTNIVVVSLVDKHNRILSRANLTYDITPYHSQSDSSQTLPSGLWRYTSEQSNGAGRTTRSDFWHLSGAKSGNFAIMKFETTLSPGGKWIKYGDLLGDARSFSYTVRTDFDDAQRNGNVLTLARGRGRLMEVQPDYAREAAVNNASALLSNTSQTFTYQNGHLAFNNGDELQPQSAGVIIQ
jgi:hypothetical protein